MTPTFRSRTALAAFCAALSFSAGPFSALGQTAVSPRISESDRKDEALQLSPFIVAGEKENGYEATDTLAGTRLRTPLRDISASISVVTKQLMEDTGSTKALDLFVYTAGTEIAGIGGNTSGAIPGGNFNFNDARRDPNPINRLRGLAPADTTRNFFGTLVPLDSYNTQSVTINRGANAILFGLGSPAGIIENTTLSPEFRNRVRVQVRAASYDSHRETLDLERVLIDRKLSLRVTGVTDNQKFEQDFSYRDVRRYYGALEYRPFKTTTFRINAETGKQKQQMPRTNPPLDGLSSWFLYGKLGRADNILGPPFTLAEADQAFERLDNLDGSLGFSAGLNNPSLFYSAPGRTSPSDLLDAMPMWADSRALAGQPANPNGLIYRMLGVRQVIDARVNALANPPTNGLADDVLNFTFASNPVLLDRSIYDYRKHSLYGPNGSTVLKFDAFNAAAEQLFFGGNAGIELVLDRQSSVTDRVDNFTGARSDSLGIDVNRQLTNGSPNPNFGRPVVSGLGSADRVARDDQNIRATAFFKHDFRRTFDGWFGRLLGQQTATVFYTDAMAKAFTISGYNAVVSPSYTNASGGGNAIAGRQLNAVIYVGPSLVNASGPAGAEIGNVQSQVVWPSTLNSWTINAGTNYEWARQNHAVYQYPDFTYLASGVTASRQEITTYGEVLQGYWVDGLLVSTLGWRHDLVENFSSPNNALDPVTGARFLNRPSVRTSLARANTLFSSGLALHTPKRWVERLPGRTDLSLYYNDSENFRLTGPRNTIFNQPLGPEGGSTKELGIGLSTFKGKLNLRATRYETRQENTTDPRVAQLLTWVTDLETRMLQSNTPAQIAASGYLGFGHPGASQLFKDYMSTWNFRITEPLAGGFFSSGVTPPAGVAEVTGAISKGYEVEAVYNPLPNWRITTNVFQQEATRGEAAQNLDVIVADRLAEWSKPAVAALNGGPNFTVKTFTESRQLIYLRAKVSANQPVTELREWRANLITNYEFTRQSRLKGWGIGGAARWQEGVVVGYPVITSPVGLIQDADHPFKSDDELALDSWISYQRPLFKNKIRWKLQLNVRNLLNDNLLIPVAVNPVAVGDRKNSTLAVARIGEARTWALTSTLDF